MSRKKVNFKVRLARQGWFACLPMPPSVADMEGLFELVENVEGDLVQVSTKSQIVGVVKLWRTIIDRTLLYTFSSDRECRRDALDWFDSVRLKNNQMEDFLLACDLAILEPEWVSEAALELHERFMEDPYCYYIEDDL